MTSKNVDNVEFEEINNPFYGNQFIGYFVSIPQTGYYKTSNELTLKPKYVDSINGAIRGVTIPETNNNYITVPYFGHQNVNFNGVGDGELGNLTIRMKLDRYMNCYTSFLNWSYMVYDWSAGGINNNLGINSQSELEGIFYVEFLDAEEEQTRKMKYKILIQTVPQLNLGVDSPDEIDIDINFKVSEIDPSEFVVSQPLKDGKRI
jgi:hypothetical protein